MIFAFQVLPTIIFISAFFAVLYHIGVMQLVIRFFARLMQATMKISGAESLNVAASIFMGQTEAPLTIRPFLSGATTSELMTIMTSGMAHVSGGIMAAYILYGIEAQHLLAAVIMTAPGTIVIAKMLVPETERSCDRRHRRDAEDGRAQGRKSAGRDCARNHRRRSAGLQRCHHADLVPGAGRARSTESLAGRTICWAPTTFPFPSSLNAILGFFFAPIAWLIGIPWHDARLVGNLLGTRMVINELVAYSMLGAQKAAMDYALVYHCHVRSMRFCKSKFHRHADWRHRRTGSHATQRSCQARPAGHARRHHGKPYVGVDCRRTDAVEELKGHCEHRTI